MKSAILYGGTSHQYFFFERKDQKYKNYFNDIIYILDVPSIELEQYDYILVPSRMNQDILLNYQNKFINYLNHGGHIVAFGEMVKPWIPNIQWREYPTNYYWWTWKGADLPLYCVKEEHPLFKHITVDDAKWHYHGVFLPPSCAEPLLVNELDEAIIYVDKHSYKGKLYLTTLDPDYHFGQGFIPKVETFLNGYLTWVEQDIEKRTVDG